MSFVPHSTSLHGPSGQTPNPSVGFAAGTQKRRILPGTGSRTPSDGWELAGGAGGSPAGGQMGFVSFWEAEAHGGRMLDVRPSARGSSESFQRRRLDWEPRALVPLLPSINHFCTPGFILSLLADDSAAV